MTEPRWITRELASAMHRAQLRAHGGRWGIRDENLLESALARPQQPHAYEPDAGLFELAAAYAFGIARNHPFVDGNKRTAFTAMGVFLLANGYLLEVPEPEAVLTMLAVAAGRIEEPELAAWCRAHCEAA